MMRKRLGIEHSKRRRHRSEAWIDSRNNNQIQVLAGQAGRNGAVDRSGLAKS